VPEAPAAPVPAVPAVPEIDVIDDPAAAVVALDPVRASLLAELSTPSSAAALAARVGITRQKVNYHLRTLEAHGLVRQVDSKQWGGLTERLLVATASSYVVSPQAMGPMAPDPGRAADRASARYLLALAARLVREVGSLVRRADEAGKRLPTLALDTEIRFASTADRAAFADDLAQAVTALVSRYHDESAPGGRWHRLVIAAHPRPAADPPAVNEAKEETS
jgi:predicted ArsR family transcriptional regulator